MRFVVDSLMRPNPEYSEAAWEKITRSPAFKSRGGRSRYKDKVAFVSSAIHQYGRFDDVYQKTTGTAMYQGPPGAIEFWNAAQTAVPPGGTDQRSVSVGGETTEGRESA